MREKILSAGVIVVRLVEQTPQYLLLRAYSYWDFPKGEVEAGEDPLHAAVREVQEETTLGELVFRHMLFLDGVYVERPDGSLRFRWVKAPSGAELIRLNQTLARRIGRYLERQGLLERDAENSYLAGDELEAGPMEQLPGSSITYRIAVGPQQGRKVFTLQTLPACDEPFDDGVGKVAGFSLHAGLAARADERKNLKRRVAKPWAGVIGETRVTEMQS